MAWIDPGDVVVKTFVGNSLARRGRWLGDQLVGWLVAKVEGGLSC